MTNVNDYKRGEDELCVNTQNGYERLREGDYSMIDGVVGSIFERTLSEMRSKSASAVEDKLAQQIAKLESGMLPLPSKIRRKCSRLSEICGGKWVTEYAYEGIIILVVNHWATGDAGALGTTMEMTIKVPDLSTAIEERKSKGPF